LRNIKLCLSFDGTNYHGWQSQINAHTVQDQLNNAITRIVNEDINVIGCGRTDANVHANEYYCNFETESEIKCSKLLLALNGVLPKDIVIKSCQEVDINFNSRYHCIKKEYIYKIYNGAVRNPFLDKYSLYYPYKLDVVLLNNVAQCFVGTHNFKGFMATGSKIKDTVRTVYSASVSREGDLVIFKVCANGFLYKMVRIMVGTLIFVERGRILADNLPLLIKEQNRKKLGTTANPKGLFLNKVYYSSWKLKIESEKL